MSGDMGVWIAAIVTIGLISFVFKENNALYRIVESLYVGVSAGYAIVVGWGNVRTLALQPLSRDGRTILVVPIILGLLLYARFFKRWAWLSRIPVAFLGGIGTGLAMRGLILSQVVNQIKACYVPPTSFNNVFIAAGTLLVLLYFFFTIEQRGVIKHAARVGRYVMMVGFGASFAGTATGRISLFIGRLQFLLGDWLGLIK